MNLLDHFVLHHVQVSALRSELLRVTASPRIQDAKVELNLTPRMLDRDADTDLPSYQVSASLDCEGGHEGESGPAFRATVGVEAIYRQVSGPPMDKVEFTSHHASLARQLYPLLQHELRGLLSRMGMSEILLPFDLAPGLTKAEGTAIEVSSSLH